MKRILLASVPSTNDYALELLRSERPEEGTVVQAMLQTRGRGLADARWESEAAVNLTVSVILYPAFLEPRRQFELSKAMALAVSDCATALTGIEARIKWPNDVLLAGRKVAGLLIESRISARRIEQSVVGIGLNVNQQAFPRRLHRAASLRGLTGREHSLEKVLADLHARLLIRYEELRDLSPSIDADYLSRLHGLGQELEYSAQGTVFRGTIQGVDEEGRLLVREAGGTLGAYGVKQIVEAGGEP